jgi:hypothetical protein
VSLRKFFLHYTEIEWLGPVSPSICLSQTTLLADDKVSKERWNGMLKWYYKRLECNDLQTVHDYIFK